VTGNSKGNVGKELRKLISDKSRSEDIKRWYQLSFSDALRRPTCRQPILQLISRIHRCCQVKARALRSLGPTAWAGLSVAGLLRSHRSAAGLCCGLSPWLTCRPDRAELVFCHISAWPLGGRAPAPGTRPTAHFRRPMSRPICGPLRLRVHDCQPRAIVVRPVNIGSFNVGAAQGGP
jgi:hypothetical protein